MAARTRLEASSPGHPRLAGHGTARAESEHVMKTAFALLVPLGLPATAFAQVTTPVVPTPNDSTNATSPEIVRSQDEHRELPIVAYTYTAFGVPSRTLGMQGYGLGIIAAGQDSIASGGGTVWGSPIDRLTLVVDARRNLSRNFSPSAAAIFRLIGDGREGLTFGALGKFKIDGFAAGPRNDEIESEVELGALFSYASGGWCADVNAIAGRGTGDEGETDAEARLRLGRALGSSVRVGVDGQARIRLAGPQYLPNGRTWDFSAGPQVLVYMGNLFGSLTAGPTMTALLSTNIGWSAMLAAGGTTF